MPDLFKEIIPSILQTKKSVINDDIDAKELIWTNLSPKTRTITDPITQDTTTVDIQKSEIVKPTIPDYYILRKREYPVLSDQLDAIWKGPNSPDFINMQNKINSIKTQYPKTNYI